jgi:beta-lactamase class D
MSSRTLLLFVLLLPLRLLAKEPAWQAHPEWSSEFSSRGLVGTALIYVEANHQYLVFDPKRAQTPYLPASTFKICNALIGLETGAVADEHAVTKWDGVKRSNDKWNRDTDLAAGMRYSTVWFYQAMARRIGMARMQEWITRLDYGNRNIGGGIDQFWLSGALRISAAQQIDFLRRLAAGTLPLSAGTQETVRRITIMDSAPDYVLHAKTGWGHADGDKSDIGWYVGWVERNGQRWFFALNMDLPSYDNPGSVAENGPKREAIVRALLTQAGALPPTRN